MTTLDKLTWELAIANRILERENVVDAFGHISARHPDNPDRYLLSQSRSPGIVSQNDIMEFQLDNTPIDQQDRPVYIERPIHGSIYEARPDVQSVVHNHSHAVIPFGVTGVPMRQLIHVAGGMGADIPVWDIRDKFGDTNLLVTTREQGEDLATSLGQGAVALMRGHGCVIASQSIKHAVHLAIYVQANASLLLDSIKLGGDINFLSPGEMAESAAMNKMPNVAVRTWDYWVARANVEGV